MVSVENLSTLRFHSPPGVNSDKPLLLVQRNGSVSAMLMEDLWALPACMSLGLPPVLQDLVVTPPVPTLSQCCLTTGQYLLQAWVWGIAELAVFLGAVPPALAGAGESVVGGMN